MLVTKLIFFSCFALSLSWAMEPFSEKELENLLESGELESRLDFAEEIGNHQMDSFLLRKAILEQQVKVLQSQGVPQAEINRMLPELAPPPRWQGMPTTGNVNILAVLVEFQDYSSTSSRNEIHNKLFGNGDPSESPYESLAKYYERSSYGKLNLSGGSTLGWYKTSYNRSEVTRENASDGEQLRDRENLIKEILSHYDNQGHDFSQYDNDNDGDIDYFIVIWTGPDNGWSNFWWGYQTSFTDSSYRLDGKQLSKYSWQWETSPFSREFIPTVVIHETGHALGLPDYYDYSPSRGPKGGVGKLDMMDGNKGDHNCFSKWVLEWVTPQIISSGIQTLELEASGNSEDCVIIWPGITNGDLFSEFFVVQNRHRVGNDNARRIPGDGLLIWHVDARLKNGFDFEYNNSYTGRKLLRLMEADGLEEIENLRDIADGGDYYAKGSSFTPDTTPSSKKYDGTDSDVRVYDISPSGEIMSATFVIGEVVEVEPKSVAFGVVHIDGRKWSGTANWTSTYNAVEKYYEISIENENYNHQNYTTTVTPTTGVISYCSTTSSDSNLLVHCYDKNGDLAETPFSFVTFKQ